MVSINPNYSTVYASGSTSSSSGTSETTGVTEEPLFTSEADDKKPGLSEKETNELETQLAAYQAQKQQLEAQLQQYQNEKAQLETRNAALENKANQLRAEIQKVEADREAYEAKAKEQKEKYEKDNITLLSLIKKMNEKINETNQTVAQAAQEQDKKIEDATAEAFKKYEAGEITEDEIPSYIAKKTGNQNLIDQLATSGLNAVNSFSSQVKSLIAQMAQALNYLNQNKVNIETATEKINNTNAQLEVVQQEQAVVNEDIKAVNTQIRTTNVQIKVIDAAMTFVEQKLGKNETEADATTEGVETSVTEPETDSTTSSNPFAAGNNDLGLDLDSFVSVTTTIDFRGFKSTLDNIMTQTNQSVQTLREQIHKQREQQKTAA